MSITEEPSVQAESSPPYLRSTAEVVATLQTDVTTGLSVDEAAARLASHGPNQIVTEKPPSTVAVALGQLRDPMNIMLVAVAVVSLVIGQASTALLVALLVVLNVVLGTRQELKARASVDALSKLQVPQSRVLRGREVALTPAVDVVPGDVVLVEAGDIVPADGRIVTSATLETQEAALTGESAPVGKDAAVLAGPEVSVGDRTN
ncbi:MAG: cation-transporting P-type ATPase, partial [Nocardioidaceae bacterium]